MSLFLLLRGEARGAVGVYGGVFLLRGSKPCVVVVLAHHFDFDGHKGMTDAAELGALTVERSKPRRLEPCVIETPGDRIHLHAHLWQRPGMDDIRASCLDLHHLVHWDFNRIVDAEQPWLMSFNRRF